MTPCGANNRKLPSTTRWPSSTNVYMTCFARNSRWPSTTSVSVCTWPAFPSASDDLAVPVCAWPCVLTGVPDYPAFLLFTRPCVLPGTPDDPALPKGRPAGVPNQEDGDWPFWDWYLVLLPLPWRVCTSTQNIPLWILPQVHEDGYHLAATFGEASLPCFGDGLKVGVQMFSKQDDSREQ